MTIFEWLSRRCPECKRVRVHYRTSGGVRCIGTLPGRTYSPPCGSES